MCVVVQIVCTNSCYYCCFRSRLMFGLNKVRRLFHDCVMYVSVCRFSTHCICVFSNLQHLNIYILIFCFDFVIIDFLNVFCIQDLFCLQIVRILLLKWIFYFSCFRWSMCRLLVLSLYLDWSTTFRCSMHWTGRNWIRTQST